MPGGRPVSRWPRALRAGGGAVLLAYFFYHAVTGPLRLPGDAGEYMLQTQAIVFDGRLSVDPAARRAYWNRTNPFGHTLGPAREPAARLEQGAQAGGGFGGLYPDRAGRYRYYHFWLYSLLAAPLYAFLHLLDPGGALEYSAFRWMNALWLFAPLLVAWRRGAGWALGLALAVTLVSPLIPYVDWAHPELFCWSCVMLAFFSAASARWCWAGPLLIGAAACQNPPLIVFLPAHVVAWRTAAAEPPARQRMAWAYAGGLLLAGVAPVYFRACFGVWNVISAVGLADLAHCSLRRALLLLFGPINGAAWFFPACFLLLPAVLRRANAAFFAAAAPAVLLAAWLASATGNLNSAQVGATRYAVWLVAPLMFLTLNGPWLPAGRREPARALAFLAALALAAFELACLRAGQLVDKRIERFGGAARGVPEVAALVRWIPYRDDAETLAETIRGAELAHRREFCHLYIWDLGGGESLLLLPRRALDRQPDFTWSWPDPPRFRAWPPNDLFRREPGGVRLDPARATNFLLHPSLGPYIHLRVARAVPPPRGVAPVIFRPYRAE